MSATDDSFELYDLRVEVVAPGRRRDLLRRQAGRLFRAAGRDALTCRRARASRSIRWRRVLPLLPAKQRATDPQRLDDDRRGGRLPRPELPDALPDHAARAAPLQPWRTTAVPLPAASGDDRLRDASSLRPGYEISRVIRGGWQLAGGHGAVDREAGRRRHGRLLPTPASPPSTAPTSIPASRS